MFKFVACRRDEVEPEKLNMGDTTLKSGWMNSTAFAVLAVFGAGAVPAMAQQAAAKVAAADARNDGIADIVVTATRRSQNLQDVPIAVQALSGDTLRQLGVANFDKLIEFLPNVRTGGRGPGQSQIYIRGLSTDTQSILVAGSAGVNPNVALYLDDAPVSAPARNLDVYTADLNRVEVLAGPQGTLFGASAMGGAVRYITNRPDLSEIHAGFKGSYSFTKSGDESNSVEGFINVPIIKDKLAVRLVLYNDSRGGYIDNVAGSFRMQSNANNGLGVGSTATRPTITNSQFVEDNFNDASYRGGRLSIKYQVNDDWSINAQHMRQQLRVDGVFDYDPLIGDLKVQRYNPDELDDKFDQTSWSVDGRLGMLDVIYTGAYLNRRAIQKVDYTAYSNAGPFAAYYICKYPGYATCATPRMSFQGNNRNTRLSQEFRVSTPVENRWRVIAGAYFDRAKIYDIGEFNYEGSIEQGFVPNKPFANATSINPNARNPGVTFFNDITRTDRQIAGFGELAFDIIPEKLTITGGMRYYNSRASIAGSANFGNRGVDRDSGYNLDVIHTEPRTDSGVIFKGNLTFKPNDDMLFYGTYSEGFRPGGFNRIGQLAGGTPQKPKVGIPFGYDTDQVKNFELGAKLTLFDRKVVLNLAAYHIDWKDIQVAVYDPQLFFLTFAANCCDAKINGIEGDLTVQPVPGLTFNAAASYNDSELTRAAVSGQSLGGIIPLGSQLALSPKFQGNVRVRYDHEMDSGLKAFGQAGIHHVGASHTSINVNADYPLPAYTTADLSAGIEKDQWSATFFVENLTDERPAVFINASDRVARTTTIRPRTMGLRVAYQY
jgi:outer membrane receptor protein involved in Fe transport